MVILGIETSCDETAASVVKDGQTVLSNVVASSEEIHKSTGGIVPENAAREQVGSIIPVIAKAIEPVGLDKIDTIAVTYGPGLIGSLLVGVETAKTLSYVWDKPIIPVNHVLAHLYSPFVNDAQPEFPIVGLIVSGGHTELVHMKNHNQIEVLGGTRDDAAGEAFDKTARLLGLPYPGGPAIAEIAAAAPSNDNVLDLFPRPMINSDDYDFSFSGLKTAVLNETRDKKMSDTDVQMYAANIQEAIVDVLVSKSLKAVEECNPKSFVLGGGVAANRHLQERFKGGLQDSKTNFYVGKHNTDNAVMIATAAFYQNNPVDWRQVSADPELAIV